MCELLTNLIETRLNAARTRGMRVANIHPILFLKNKLVQRFKTIVKVFAGQKGHYVHLYSKLN